MRKWYLISLLLLALAMVTLTACGKRAPVVTGPEVPSLEQVRRQADAALDSSLPSKQRQQARNDAMQTLLGFLRRPESGSVAKTDWEQPFKAPTASLRYYETGKVRVLALTIPGSGVVPPGERVAVQYAGGGTPQAYEVEVLPGGKLVGARLMDDKALMLAFSLARGGGYVAHYVRDSRTGEFKPDAAPFRGLPLQVGDIRFEVRKEFFVADVPVDAAWQPQFDPAHPNRFYLNADLAVEFKQGKFELVDERNFTAFQGFVTAANTSLPEKDRKEAWDKATRKLPAYLATMESLQDDLAAKLPPGARYAQDQESDTLVRIVSIPAPEFAGAPAFTIVQHRSGNGMPAAQVLNLPGLMESFQVVLQRGLPGLVVVSGAQKGNDRVITLFRQATGNNWEPAPEWFGFMPTGEGVPLEKAAGASLTVKGTASVSPDWSVQVCGKPDDCFTLAWVGSRLSGAGWLGRQVRMLAGPVTASQVMAVANTIKQYMLTPEASEASGAELAAVLGEGTRGWDPGGGARVLALPTNGAGILPVIVQAGNVAVVETPAPGAIDQWQDARAVQAGGGTWLLLLGRRSDRAALVLYQITGAGPQPVDALAEPTDKSIGEWSKIVYTPGQTEPVRGLYAVGKNDLKAYFTPEGSGVAFCEENKQCTIYRFDQRWGFR